MKSSSSRPIRVMEVVQTTKRTPCSLASAIDSETDGMRYFFMSDFITPVPAPSMFIWDSFKWSAPPLFIMFIIHCMKLFFPRARLPFLTTPSPQKVKNIVTSMPIEAPVLARLKAVSYTHLRAHETRHDLVCRLLLEKKKN